MALASVIATGAPAPAADFGWLEEALDRIQAGRGAALHVRVSAANAAPDRAAVLVDRGEPTEVLLLYAGRTDRGTAVEFRGTSRPPTVSDLHSLVPPSGIPPKYLAVDRDKAAATLIILVTDPAKVQDRQDIARIEVEVQSHPLQDGPGLQQY